MIKPRYITVFPKLDSYNSLSELGQFSSKKLINKVIEELDEYNLVQYIIAEDELAQKFYGDKKDKKVVSVLSKMDSIFINKYTSIYDGYIELSENKCNLEIIKETGKNIKKRLPNENEDARSQVYLASVAKTVMSRIRVAATSYVNTFDVIVIFKRGAGVARDHTPKVGDRKMYIEVDLVTDRIDYYYTGVPLNLEDFKRVMEGITNG